MCFLSPTFPNAPAHLPYTFRPVPKPLKNFKAEQFSKNLTRNPFYSSLIKSNLLIWARSFSLGGREESNLTLYKGTCHTKADALRFYEITAYSQHFKSGRQIFYCLLQVQVFLTFLGLSDPTGL